jgi:hypothetical protein
MPQCAHCQTPYEEGQRYCNACGSFLLHPEEGDTFCPQCGIRVSSRQDFCHECNAALKGEAATGQAPETPPTAAPPPGPSPAVPIKGVQPWVMGLLVGAGVIIVILLILLFSRGTPPPAPTPAVSPKAEAPAPAPPAPPAVAPTPAPPPAPTAPVAVPDLKEGLMNVLSNMKDAHLKKDIIQYMSCYSLTFPDLDEKRKNTLKAWDNFDYTNLVFTIDEVKPIDSENANAQATWYIDTRNRRTQELSSVKQTYQTRFAKELGKWRIRSLEELE